MNVCITCNWSIAVLASVSCLCSCVCGGCARATAKRAGKLVAECEGNSDQFRMFFSLCQSTFPHIPIVVGDVFSPPDINHCLVWLNYTVSMCRRVVVEVGQKFVFTQLFPIAYTSYFFLWSFCAHLCSRTILCMCSAIERTCDFIVDSYMRVCHGIILKRAFKCAFCMLFTLPLHTQ